MTNYAIQASNLNKIYKKRSSNLVHALIDFNISIPKGSIYGLLGPNGAGKSTFINILGGLVNKNNGIVKIGGLNIDTDSKQTRQKIGIVPQELNIDPFFTPFELLEIQAGLYGIRKKNRKTEEILSRLGLWEQKNSYSRTLSGGMRRRLLVAKALVHDPEILILDEPTAGVDVELRQNLWKYIIELNKNGKTICLTTHYLEEAENLCQFITIINNGKIIKSDTKANLLDLIGNKIVSFELESIERLPEELNQFKPIIKDKNLILNYDKNIVKLPEIINILNKNKINFKEISTKESDLEDVFIKLTK
ncbi:MAG: ABC transporter [Rickettsiales bacterium]|nr:ABC transporter [Rickettsiales bacterium]